MTRLRVDIADLHLGQALETVDNSVSDSKFKNNVIGISKHLCGAATDLTLRLVNKGAFINYATLLYWQKT